MMNPEDEEISALVRSKASYYEAPEELRTDISRALKSENRAEAPPRFAVAWQNWWGMSASFAMGLLLAVVGMFTYGQFAQQNRLEGQLVDSHIRSMMVAHLSDVASTDQHTVKPWFDGKLDYAPPVRDLAGEGFPLIGGRLDYFNGRPVAALIYRRHLHVINVFVWPVQSNLPFASISTSTRGFNLKSWQSEGMEFWAVSDVSVDDLQAFSQMLRANEKPPASQSINRRE